MTYIKKDDKLYKVTEQEIDLVKLENEIARLEQDIENIPEPKTEPDQETLEHYNMQRTE